MTTDHNDTGSGSTRLKTTSAWEQALAELEDTKPVPKGDSARIPTATAPPPPPPKATLSAELATVIDRIADARGTLVAFEKSYPYLIAPNILGLWDVHLKETEVMLQREAERLQREGT